MCVLQVLTKDSEKLTPCHSQMTIRKEAYRI